MIARGRGRDDREADKRRRAANRSEWDGDDTTGAWETPVAIRIPVTRARRMYDAGA